MFKLFKRFKIIKKPTDELSLGDLETAALPTELYPYVELYDKAPRIPLLFVRELVYHLTPEMSRTICKVDGFAVIAKRSYTSANNYACLFW